MSLDSEFTGLMSTFRALGTICYDTLACLSKIELKALHNYTCSLVKQKKNNILLFFPKIKSSNLKIYHKRDDFDFDIVNFPFLDGDVPRATYHGVYTVDSRYLEFQGTLWNTSRYPYFDISDLQNLGKNESNSKI